MKYITILFLILPFCSPAQNGVPFKKFFNTEINGFLLNYDDAVAVAKVWDEHQLLYNEIYSQYDTITSLTSQIDSLTQQVDLNYNLEIAALKRKNEYLNDAYENSISIADSYAQDRERLRKQVNDLKWDLRWTKLKNWLFGGGLGAAILYIGVTLIK